MKIYKTMRILSVILITTAFLFSCETTSTTNGDNGDNGDNGGNDGNGGNGDINNPEGAPVLTCSDFTEDITLEDDPSRDVDYIIDCLVEVDDIEIEIIDGAVIEFTSGSGFIFNGDAQIEFFSLPNVVDPVILRGNKSEPGYWKGIHINSDLLTNSVRGVEIHDAGSTTDPQFYGAITISGGSDIGSVVVNNSANYGIYYNDEIGIYQGFGKVEITNCASYPIRIGAQEVGELGNWSDNIFENNNPNRIQVIPQEILKSTRFNYKGIPYEIDGIIRATEGSVQIEDNVEIAFKPGSRLIIERQLTAWADADDPIKLYGLEGTAGSWQGILIDTEGVDGRSIMEYVYISDGGEETYGSANISIVSGRLNLRNSRITNSRTCGVRINTVDGELYESDNIFADNQTGNICEEN